LNPWKRSLLLAPKESPQRFLLSKNP
jgi:hypothetical protein